MASELVLHTTVNIMMDDLVDLDAANIQIAFLPFLRDVNDPTTNRLSAMPDSVLDYLSRLQDLDSSRTGYLSFGGAR